MQKDKQPLRFEIENSGKPGTTLTIAGWDFGGRGNPPMLLHHANGFCGGTWQLVAEALVDQFHVIAIDARGHGDSWAGDVPGDYDWHYFADDLAAVADQVLEDTGFDRIEFGVGSSFGGIVTATAAAKRPELFKRIALLDPPIHPTEELVERFGLDIPGHNPVQAGLVAQTLKRRTEWPSVEEPRSSWRDKGMFAAWSDEAFELYLQQCLQHAEDGSVSLKCDPQVEAHIFASTGSLGVLEYAPHVTVPAYYARAETGHVPAIFCEKIAGLFDQCHYEELKGGHLLPLEVPGLVAERLRWFAANS